MNNKLYVGNMSFESTQTQLEDAFSEYGSVESVNLITDRDTGRPRGFAFVEMSNDSEAQAAIEGLDQKDFGGRKINVNIAKQRENRGGNNNSFQRGRNW